MPLKIVKKAEELAFSNKAKIINISISEKVKNFIEENLSKEIDHFKKRYKLEFNLISDKNLILPEYKIDLLNKNKKVIQTIKHIEKTEKNFTKQNYNKKTFSNYNYNKNFKKRGKFKKKYNYHSKIKKNTFENKKAASY